GHTITPAQKFCLLSLLYTISHILTVEKSFSALAWIFETPAAEFIPGFLIHFSSLLTHHFSLFSRDAYQACNCLSSFFSRQINQFTSYISDLLSDHPSSGLHAHLCFA